MQNQIKKYMGKEYNKNTESSYLAYLWIKDLSKFNESLIKTYDDNSEKGYFVDVDVKYPKKLFNSHRDLPFLPEREKNNKCKKLICTIQNRKNYVIHINSLKQALNHGLLPKKVPRVFNLIKNHD